MFHILVHHGPNKGEIVLQFAVYIVYNICKRMEGARGRCLDYFLHFWSLGSKQRREQIRNKNPLLSLDIYFKQSSEIVEQPVFS